MDTIQGWRVYDGNFRLRVFIIFFLGIGAFGAVMYWREQLLLSSEYVGMPASKQVFHSHTGLMKSFDVSAEEE